MSNLIDDIWHFITAGNGAGFLRAIVTVLIGAAVAHLSSRLVVHTLRRLLDEQLHMLIRQVVFYSVLGLSSFAALRSLGIDFSALLGAAGIFTVAIGFASQTSMSNLISGWFLIAERPFVVGDVIRIGEHTGEILSIDSLSVKLRTFNNLMVRIPNEKLIKTEVENRSRFPIRRLDTSIWVPHDVDLDAMHRAIQSSIDGENECLRQPEPQVEVESFSALGMHIVVKTWVQTPLFVAFKSRFAQTLHAALLKEKVEFARERRQVELVGPAAH